MIEKIFGILIFVLIEVISALPLHLAVKFLKGKTTILKTVFVMIITAILTGVIIFILPFGIIFAFIILIWVYREMFRLKWHKAVLVWILQIIFIFLLGIILSLLGLSIALFSNLF